ncbi:MAG: ATP-binding protein [Clostridia bacterium]|nr:ATP-binding protein [Clostridia bacterium]
MEPQGIEDGEMVVTVKNEWLKNTILELYSERLLEALRVTLGIPLGLRILSLESAQDDPGATAALPIQGNGFPTTLADEDYTFENFVVGSSNKFAHAAAQAVADKPAVLYNPLFIYGGSGLGKTHLLCAICKEIQKKNPRARILYTKGETMTIELIEAIQKGTTPEFRAKYRQVDVLLVDEIQFIGGKEFIERFLDNGNIAGGDNSPLPFG